MHRQINNYVYQNVTVNRSGVIFNLVGEAQAKSVPLTNENRTFGIALKINYSGGGTEEHYQGFNSNTDKRQTVNLVVYPNDLDKVIASVDFAFVYGYNENIGKVDVDKDIYRQYTPTIKLGFYGVPYYSPLVVRDELKHKDIVICYNSVTKYLIIKKNFWRLTYND